MKIPKRYALRRARLTVLLQGSILTVDDVLPLPRKRRVRNWVRQADCDAGRRRDV